MVQTINPTVITATMDEIMIAREEVESIVAAKNTNNYRQI